MAIATTYHYTMDLDKGGLREVLRDPLYTLNSKAHTFAVTIRENGTAANITGATCQAYFIRADGVTVPLDGSVSGNTASVALLPNCYTVQGRFGLSIDLILGDVIHTILHVDGSVYRSRTDAMTTGGSTVQSFDELAAAVKNADAAMKRRDRAVNLLDNSNFLALVNQRGQTTYTGQAVYTIDRWKQAYNGSKVTVADNGLTITPGASVQGWLRQYFEKPLPAGTQVSLYVELADGTIEVFPVSLPEAATYRQGKGYITGFNTTGIDLVVNVGDPAVTFRRVALYKGNYNRDTVPQYQPKEPVVELLQARTQLQPLMYGGKDQSFICEYVPGKNYAQCQFTLSPPMRIAPSVFVVGGGAMPRLVMYNAAGEVQVVPVTAISTSNATPTTVLVKFTTDAALPTDYRMICVDAAGGNSIYASAEQ